MKFIEKQFRDHNPPEPDQYTDWKTQENNNLESYYQSNHAKGAWEHLPSVKPKIQEECIIYFTKNELLEEFILPEQGYICAYCNRRIHNSEPVEQSDLDFFDRRASVEHLRAKSQNARMNTHDYQNLVAVCRGGERIPRPREVHCDVKRNYTHLPLHPLMPECEVEILYMYDGQIVGLSERAEQTIQILGLDTNKLKEHRAKELAKWIFDISQEGEPVRITDEEAIRRFEECSSKNWEGEYCDCCGAVLSVLRNEFNI